MEWIELSALYPNTHGQLKDIRSAAFQVSQIASIRDTPKGTVVQVGRTETLVQESYEEVLMLAGGRHRPKAQQG